MGFGFLSHRRTVMVQTCLLIRTVFTTRIVRELIKVKPNISILVPQYSIACMLKGMRGSRKFCQRGSNFDKFFFFFFFFFFERREDPNTTICGPTSARKRNAIQMAFRWRVDDGPTLNAGLVALCFFRDPDQYCHGTLYFCDFSGGWSRPPVPPPLDPPVRG